MAGHVVLLGLMGSGKTEVGKALSARLGWGVTDSDFEILASTGRTAAEHVAEQGVAYLHALEREQLLGSLANVSSLVVCAAASVVDELACREALTAPSIRCVWLRASVATLVHRFMSSNHRPRYDVDLSAMFRAQTLSRAPHFAAVSTMEVVVDDRSVEDITDEIFEKLDVGRSG